MQLKCRRFEHVGTLQHLHIMNDPTPVSRRGLESIGTITMYDRKASDCTIPAAIHTILWLWEIVPNIFCDHSTQPIVWERTLI